MFAKLIACLAALSFGLYLMIACFIARDTRRLFPSWGRAFVVSLAWPWFFVQSMR